MNQFYSKYIIIYGLLLILLTKCSSYSINKGQQYKDGNMKSFKTLVNTLDITDKLINREDFFIQIQKIQHSAAIMYQNNKDTFQAVANWIQAGANTHNFAKFCLNIYQINGIDNFGNVNLTSYYTPIIQGRYIRQGRFQYPLYRMPIKNKDYDLPNRASIYSGALENLNLEIAYTNSLIDNFIMEVQGSGYVDYGDGKPLTLFSYSGNNNYTYRSIGKILTNRGDITHDRISIQAIRDWANKHTINEVRNLLEQNPSFVFFKPEAYTLVKGASGVPLVAKTAIACDSSLIPIGSTLLAELPLLNYYGKFTGKYEMRLMIAIDVGGAIKGAHCDIYQGIGTQAGRIAGFYNHYGRLWLLQASQNICNITNNLISSK
ncbi:Membrane-bound lytic murein transglycosylase A [Candidatus Profftia lariciata]|uniref:murein transglycosylase A n=1 Tax=Candidatus Profftia lariciata TaxID=1987921 RepID=UPI001D00B6EC|nr:murein transglycosylase A [Candidatus Profftia lariciata]UDG81255.1 Membrane-bound lytic murein transglycosylase A [Candidatus Profftia lariciata]